ncbi:ketoacyl-ACP synthase III family protein [Streptosporangium sp. NPDC000509]|uniref:ketoacyl-ACP synthase III family protein n=1 Tax=Streptosporangium sp. NPDC000509 TaxID=3366186 RepID=UPI0036A59A23
MRTPEIFVRGIGAFVPPTVSVESAVADGLCSAEHAKVHDMLGAAVAGDIPAPEMALRAAREAIGRGGADAGDLGLLLYADVWHQGPDGWSPQYYLQRHLVGGDLLALEVRQGCNGVLSALELAGGFMAGDPRRRDALIVTADNFGTARMDRWCSGPDFVLGDAGSAVVLSRETGFARLLSVSSISVPEAEELHRAGTPLFPPSATTGEAVDFSARAEEFGRMCSVDGDLALAWVIVQQRMMRVLGRTLSEAGITANDLTRTVFTSLSPEAVEHRWMSVLRMPMSKSSWDYARTVGHLGASDHLVSLDHLLSTGQLGPGDHVLLGGIGPGVTISCAVLEILSTPPWI